VRVYEPTIAPGKLHGTNLSFIEKSIPHIWKLLVSRLDELMLHAEVVVVMQTLKREEDLKCFRAMRSDQLCLDLVRTLSPQAVGGEYRAMDLPPREAMSATIA